MKNAEEGVEYSTAPADNAGSTLLHWTGVLARRKWIALSALLVAVAAGVLVIQRQTPIYQAKVTVYVDRAEPQIVNIEGVLSSAESSGNYLATQCALIRSRRILAGALEKPGIRLLPTLSTAPNPVALLQQIVSASQGRKHQATQIIEIACESPYPEDAAAIANAVTEAYIDFHASRKKSTAAEALKILERQRDNLETQLQQKEAALLEFKENTETLSFGHQSSNSVLQQLDEISRNLTQAELARIDAETKWAVLQSDPKQARRWYLLMEPGRGGAGAEQEGQVGQMLRRRISELEVELEGLQQKLGERHPQVQLARKRIEALRGDLAKAEAAARAKREAQSKEIIAAARLMLEHARAKEQALRKAHQQQYQAALALNRKAAQYNVLENDIARTRKLFDVIVNRIKEITVTEDYGVLNISVLDPAVAPHIPVRPNKPKVMLIAVLAGLGAGAAGSFLLESLDQRIRGPEDVEYHLRVPVMGIVPHISVNGQGPAAVGTWVGTHPKSREAEAYRTIRTALYFNRDSRDAKIILITSPSPGDGKSSTAANLAISMALNGQRVLLVDCDFRRPSIDKIQKLPHGRGLSSVLTAEVTCDEAIQPFANVPGLDVLSAGPIPSNPAELLDSPAFAEFFSLIKQRYDRVILDSPPMLAVTDAALLAARSDAVLMVLRVRQALRRSSIRARQVLEGVGGELAGVVLNDVPRNGRSYGSYYYYSPYYYYDRYYGRESSPEDTAEQKL